jgi:cytochrome bd ubiquinol oxidase subunit II
MHLYTLPLVFVLIGLVLYTVLAGADFGAGLWQLLAGRGSAATEIRDHAHEAMGPVWEANHVWLIFVLTVTWTAYPGAFGAIASTLSVPLFIAAIGIVMRGAAYALRSGAANAAESRRIDTVAALSSIITPFALGTMVGAIASRRVPVGNAAGHLFSSWLNPTSLLIGALAVVSSAYLAAVFMAADAIRLKRPELAERMRARALFSGLLAGLVALGGIAVLHGDAHHLYVRLFRGAALAGPVVSGLAGLATLGLVWERRYETARYSAAAAVVAVVGGWALAQYPSLLPHLSVAQAAAPHETLVVVIVAVLAGAVLLFPSLALLFSLVLRGRLDHGPGEPASASESSPGLGAPRSTRLRTRIAGALLVAGVGLLSIAEAGWAHVFGVLALLAFLPIAFSVLQPARIALEESEIQTGSEGRAAQ